MAEEFHKWRAEVSGVLQRLRERPSALPELEELRRLVELADWRSLPKVLAKMAALALLEPELKRYLPDLETAKRWMEAERERRLEIIRGYAARAGEGKVVTKYVRDWPFDPAYEFFELLEVVVPGALPILQKEIDGAPIFDHRAHATLVVVDREEFLRKYKGKRLMAVVHAAEGGRDEYFIEELRAEELFERQGGSA